MTSPDENVAVADPVPAARLVSVLPSPKSSVKSIGACNPTWISWRNAALVPLTDVTVNNVLSSNCGVLVPSLIPTHVTVPLIMLVPSVKEKVSIPPEAIGKMPLLSSPVVPDIAVSDAVPVSTMLPVGDWKFAR